MTDVLPFPNKVDSRSQQAQPDGDALSARHPISQWYVCPLAGVLASRLSATRLRPWHVTVCGVVFLGLATWRIADGAPMWGALLIWLAWCCDRLDGELARAQESASRWGAWLDANVDEAGDIALHAGCAACAAQLTGAAWPWALFTVFVGGKYLWQYGIRLEDEVAGVSLNLAQTPEPNVESLPASPLERSKARGSLLRQVVDFLGNADVRVHLLIGALALAMPVVALAFAAFYFGARASVRSFLVWRRLRRAADQAEHETIGSHHAVVVDQSTKEAA